MRSNVVLLSNYATIETKLKTPVSQTNFLLVDMPCLTLPNQFVSLTHITQLNVSACRFFSIPESFKALANVQDLQIDSNFLTYVCGTDSR